MMPQGRERHEQHLLRQEGKDRRARPAGFGPMPAQQRRAEPQSEQEACERGHVAGGRGDVAPP